MSIISSDTKICRAIANKQEVKFLITKRKNRKLIQGKRYYRLEVVGVLQDKEYNYLTFKANSFEQAFVYMLLSLLIRIDYEEMVLNNQKQSRLNILCTANKLTLYPFIQCTISNNFHIVTIDYTRIATINEVLSIYRMMGYEIKQEENNEQIILYVKGV